MNPKMLYSSVLGMPTDIDEPTLYQLLGVKPEEATPEAISKALKERTQLTRKNIPDPRFIPAIMVLQKELQEAADTLSDPKKRAAYDSEHNIGQDAAPTAKSSAEEKRDRLRKFIREQVRELSEADGTMTADNKEEIVKRLKEKGIGEKTIGKVLERIADAKEEAPAEGSSAKAAKFFEEAVDMVLQKGAMSEDDKNRFVEVGKNFGLDEEEALKIIAAKTASENMEAVQAETDESIQVAEPEKPEPPKTEPAKPEPPREEPETPAEEEPSQEQRLLEFEKLARELCPTGKPKDNDAKKEITHAVKELRLTPEAAKNVLIKINKEYKAAHTQPKEPPAPPPAPPKPRPEKPTEEQPVITEAPPEAKPEKPAAPKKKKTESRRKRSRSKIKWEVVIPAIVLIVCATIIMLFFKLK